MSIEPTRLGHDDPAGILRPLRRVRQVRQFSAEPVSDAQVDAIVDVGRWSGSSSNGQPWRFVILRDPGTLTRIAELGAPSTRAVGGAQAAIAVAIPTDPNRVVSNAFDDGRASERMLVAANLLGLGAAITWLPPRARPDVVELLGLPADRVVRTILAIGHPAPEALEARAPGNPARLPRSETVFEERWPAADDHHDA
jgi:nitroreductase